MVSVGGGGGGVPAPKKLFTHRSSQAVVNWRTSTLGTSSPVRTPSCWTLSSEVCFTSKAIALANLKDLPPQTIILAIYIELQLGMF